MSQARFWILTIPHADFLPFLPDSVVHLAGQLERGDSTAYLHWQLVASFGRAVRLAAIKRIFGQSCHAEPTRSVAARAYVFKPDTRVEGTQFELGQLPIRRNVQHDWDRIWNSAIDGRLDDIPADVRLRHYSAIRRVGADFATPTEQLRTVHCFWGATGTGKSRRAWAEAGLDAYPKDPRSKFWDGYRGQSSVVIDEFRGGIDISHLLRWFDRYPVIVEIKGCATVLKAKTIWVTSNLHPNDWYPDLDDETKQALLRRLNVVHFAAFPGGHTPPMAPPPTAP